MPLKVTNDLSASIGKVVKVAGVCYTVSLAPDCEGATAVTIQGIFDTCEECESYTDGKWYCITVDTYSDTGTGCDVFYQQYTLCAQYLEHAEDPQDPTFSWSTGVGPYSWNRFVQADGSCSSAGITPDGAKLVSVDGGPYDTEGDCNTAGCS